MKKNVVTVNPDTTIERATEIAQENRVGCLIAVEHERVVGIVTINDIFYKVVNSLFGIGEKEKRVIVYGAYTGPGKWNKCRKFLSASRRLVSK